LEPRRARDVGSGMKLRRLAFVALVALCGCPPSAPSGDGKTPPPPPRDYPGTTEGLHAMWHDILVASQKDERQKVHDLMASMMMTQDDLVALFGRERAEKLAPRYEVLISRLVNAGAMELVGQIYEKKYDDIEVMAVDANGSAADKATLAALPPGTQVWNVRVKRKDAKLGLRYDFFVHRRGRWLTGNLLGKYLAEQAGGPSVRDGGTGGPGDASAGARHP